jgi:hypothetical protein
MIRNARTEIVTKDFITLILDFYKNSISEAIIITISIQTLKIPLFIHIPPVVTCPTAMLAFVDGFGLVTNFGFTIFKRYQCPAP